MNKEMLKYLVSLSSGKINCVDTSIFFNHYPNNSDTLNDLRNLSNFGYITILYASNEVQEIGVNKKALDFFN